jgi:hypothetical protein
LDCPLHPADGSPRQQNSKKITPRLAAEIFS